MNIAFLLWSPDISGGTNVIFEHATRLHQCGHNVTIVTLEKINLESLKWFPEASKLDWQTIHSVSGFRFDLCIATWWRTVFYLKYVNAAHYSYFVQSIESRFYSENDVILRNLVELTYTLDLKIITEASWIKDYLFKFYNKNAFLVLNGIRKDNLNEYVEAFSPRDPNKLRVLVEGPLGVSFKNTELAIQLALSSKADEVWLLTSTNLGSYPNISRLYSRLPAKDVGRVYASVDVLVKLSTVEGMFGPPLEAFHCGATSITYDVTGYDEYIIPNVNGLVSFSRDNVDIVNYINMLSDNRDLLNSLKHNALDTAREWPNWEESSKKFLEVCQNIVNSPTVQNIKIISRQADLLWEQYEKSLQPLTLEYNLKSIVKKKVSSKLFYLSPRLHALVRKIWWIMKVYCKR